MTSTQPTINPTARYNEAQAARLLEVTSRTIRRWRDAGHLKEMPRPVNSKRVYFKGIDLIRAYNTH